MPPLPGLLRVLIVDDEKVLADSLAMICITRGVAARAVYSAEDAILLSQSFHPHAVISDVKMAGMSGIDLATYLEESQPQCQVLLVSGHEHAYAFAEERWQRGHFHAVLTKPVRPTQIMDFLCSCVEAVKRIA